MPLRLHSHIRQLESESIFVMREVAAVEDIVTIPVKSI